MKFLKCELVYYKSIAYVSLMVLTAATIAGYLWQVAHKQNMDRLIMAYQGVLNGTPHYLTYQNRVLGPMLVMLMPGNEYQQLMLFVAVSVLVGFSMLAVFMLRIGYIQFIPYAITLSLCIWYWGMHEWSFPWDFIEMIWMLVFCAMVQQKKPFMSFFILFFIAILNRESALIIILYPLFCAVLGKMERKVFCASLGSLFIGIVFVKAVRKVFYKHSFLSGDDRVRHIIGNQLQLNTNMQALADYLGYGDMSHDIPFFFFVIKTSLYFFLIFIHMVCLGMAVKQNKTELMILSAIMVVYLFSFLHAVWDHIRV